MDKLIPSKIVEELDKYIVGQQEAKKAVAVALRNRFRRSLLPRDLQDDIYPKNILMIGPTGVGKTEIARRLAQMTQAAFLKVEATKYTEVGYMGRDVESMVRDLVEISIRMLKKELLEAVKDQAQSLAVDRLVKLLNPKNLQEFASSPSPFNMFFPQPPPAAAPQPDEAAREEERNREKTLREKLLSGELKDKMVEIEVEEAPPSVMEMFSGTGMEEVGFNFQELVGGMFPKKKKKRRVSVDEALKVLVLQEAEKLIDAEEIKRLAIERAEQHGIIFVDEMDKIAGGGRSANGPDVSREGVQRDILPIVEGSTVMTKYGPVKTDHMLFIGAGAFNVSKPSDLIPELQGRFPIRVELSSLTRDDFKRILTEPKNALTKQYQALLATEEVNLDFTSDGIEEMARIAQIVNEQTENIGARRLHTIMEKVLEEISFAAPERKGEKVKVDREYVAGKLEEIMQSEDLSRFVL